MMKSEIILEAFDNGITWREKSTDTEGKEVFDDVLKVIYDKDKSYEIGCIINNDIELVMNKIITNKVKIQITIEGV